MIGLLFLSTIVVIVVTGLRNEDNNVEEVIGVSGDIFTSTRSRNTDGRLPTPDSANSKVFLRVDKEFKVGNHDFGSIRLSVDKISGLSFSFIGKTTDKIFSVNRRLSDLSDSNFDEDIKANLKWICNKIGIKSTDVVVKDYRLEGPGISVGVNIGSRNLGAFAGVDLASLGITLNTPDFELFVRITAGAQIGFKGLNTKKTGKNGVEKSTSVGLGCLEASLIKVKSEKSESKISEVVNNLKSKKPSKKTEKGNYRPLYDAAVSIVSDSMGNNSAAIMNAQKQYSTSEDYEKGLVKFYAAVQQDSESSTAKMNKFVTATTTASAFLSQIATLTGSRDVSKVATGMSAVGQIVSGINVVKSIKNGVEGAVSMAFNGLGLVLGGLNMISSMLFGSNDGAEEAVLAMWSEMRSSFEHTWNMLDHMDRKIDHHFETMMYALQYTYTSLSTQIETSTSFVTNQITLFRHKIESYVSFIADKDLLKLLSVMKVTTDEELMSGRKLSDWTSTLKVWLTHVASIHARTGELKRGHNLDDKSLIDIYKDALSPGMMETGDVQLGLMKTLLCDRPNMSLSICQKVVVNTLNWKQIFEIYASLIKVGAHHIVADDTLSKGYITQLNEIESVADNVISLLYDSVRSESLWETLRDNYEKSFKPLQNMTIGECPHPKALNFPIPLDLSLDFNGHIHAMSSIPKDTLLNWLDSLSPSVILDIGNALGLRKHGPGGCYLSVNSADKVNSFLAWPETALGVCLHVSVPYLLQTGGDYNRNYEAGLSIENKNYVVHHFSSSKVGLDANGGLYKLQKYCKKSWFSHGNSNTLIPLQLISAADLKLNSLRTDLLKDKSDVMVTAYRRYLELMVIVKYLDFSFHLDITPSAISEVSSLLAKVSRTGTATDWANLRNRLSGKNREFPEGSLRSKLWQEEFHSYMGDNLATFDINNVIAQLENRLETNPIVLQMKEVKSTVSYLREMIDSSKHMHAVNSFMKQSNEQLGDNYFITMKTIQTADSILGSLIAANGPEGKDEVLSSWQSQLTDCRTNMTDLRAFNSADNFEAEQSTSRKAKKTDGTSTCPQCKLSNNMSSRILELIQSKTISVDEMRQELESLKKSKEFTESLNAGDVRCRPLVVAIGCGRLDVVKMLLEYDAEIVERDIEDNVPVDISAVIHFFTYMRQATLGEKIDTRLTLSLLSRADREFSKHSALKDVILLAGPTKTGKSTAINHVLGVDYVMKKNTLTNKNYLEATSVELSSTSASSQSETSIPVILQGSGYTFIDMPGFSAGQGIEYDILTALSGHLLRKIISSLKLVMLGYEYIAIYGGGSHLFSNLNAWSHMVGGNIDNAVLFINKVPYYEAVSPAQIKAHLVQVSKESYDVLTAASISLLSKIPPERIIILKMPKNEGDELDDSFRREVKKLHSSVKSKQCSEFKLSSYHVAGEKFKTFLKVLRSYRVSQEGKLLASKRSVMTVYRMQTESLHKDWKLRNDIENLVYPKGIPAGVQTEINTLKSRQSRMLAVEGRVTSILRSLEQHLASDLKNTSSSKGFDIKFLDSDMSSALRELRFLQSSLAYCDEYLKLVNVLTDQVEL